MIHQAAAPISDFASYRITLVACFNCKRYLTRAQLQFNNKKFVIRGTYQFYMTLETTHIISASPNPCAVWWWWQGLTKWRSDFMCGEKRYRSILQHHDNALLQQMQLIRRWNGRDGTRAVCRWLALQWSGWATHRTCAQRRVLA